MVKIDLHNTNIEKINDQWLALSRNHLQDSSRKSIKDVMKHLNLSFNAIKSINEDQFCELKKLTKLELQNNQISTIEKNAFSGLRNLNELNMANNELETITRSDYTDVFNLIWLFLSNNQIHTIEENSFEDIPKLRYLYLSKNFLRELKTNLFCISNSLHSLYLNDNQIDKLSSNVFMNLNNLNILDLSSNRFECIENSYFMGLLSLTHLNLHGNRIKRIEENSFASLKNLILLDLSENQMTNVSNQYFINIFHLTGLYLNSNRIKSVETDAFKHQSKIADLDLSDNNIETLTLDFDLTQWNLMLNLSFNQIKFIKLTLIDDNYVKFYINISSNRLKMLSDLQVISKKNQSNYFIFARFNYFESITEKDIRKVENLENCKFDFRNNPLDESSLEILSDEENSKYFTIDSSSVKHDDLITKMNFNLIDDYENNLVQTFDDWNDISGFSAITGTNGVGKSTALAYIKDVIHEFYRATNQIFDRKNFKKLKNRNYFLESIQKFNSNIQIFDDKNGIEKLDIKKLFIPVVYKMHDTIKPNMISSEELKKILPKFRQTFRNAQNPMNGKLLKSVLRDNSFDFIQKTIDIFSADSVDKLVLQFKNQKNFINQHLNDFKYEIAINDDELPKVTFKQRNSPDSIELTSEKLSPGEQLILMFRLWEFALTRFQIVHTPVLLLDEPDAHLHPKAVKEFVVILEKLAKAGAQIIMTTHNPTTVSLVKKENLYCMRKLNDGRVAIQRPVSKAHAIQELTDNLIVVNEPFKVVLVEGEPNSTLLQEPKYIDNERDALFFRHAYSFWSNNCAKNERSKNTIYPQIAFHSSIGHNNIIQCIGHFDCTRLHQNHCGIIDNDNFFDLIDNSYPQIREYYSMRRRNVFNLLRNGLENYALDPVNFFIHLNYLVKLREGSAEKASEVDSVWRNFQIDLKKVNEFYRKIAARLKVNNEILALKCKKSIKANKIKENISIFKAFLNEMSESLINYLTEKKELNYRIFESRHIFNLTPLFRFTQFYEEQEFPNREQNNDQQTLEKREKNEKSKPGVKFKQKKEFNFCSPIFAKNLRTQKWPDLFLSKWNQRLKLLNNSQEEKEKRAKANELTILQIGSGSIVDQLNKIIKSGNLCYGKYEPGFELYKKIYESEHFLEWIKTDELKKRQPKDQAFKFYITQKLTPEQIEDYQKEVESKTNNYKAEKQKITKNELEQFVELKSQLDQSLMQHIREYLNQTVVCCFNSNENVEFEYPRVFYLLNGHLLEEAVHSLFFKGKYVRGQLINEIVREDGLMKKCGYVMPNELPEIFNRILNIDIDNERKRALLSSEKIQSESS